MVEWLAGNRIIGTTAERPNLGLPSGSVGGWVELGRHTLGSTASEVFVDSLPDKRYYMVLYEDKGQATAQARLLRYNSDSGSNYSNRTSTNGGADSTITSQTQHNGWNANDTIPQFNVWYIANLAGKEKMLISHGTAQYNPPSRTEYAGKWANTSDAINRIGVIQNAGVHGVGTTITVLGWDPADTHTTNFWEELASDTHSGADTSTFTTSTFTAKKYLWIQGFIKNGSASSRNCLFRFNADSSANYSHRRSQNGGADSTQTSQTQGVITDGFANETGFFNMFIINNSANEKLVTGHSTFNGTAGAGNANNRAEFVAKWTNTASQITSLSLIDSVSSDAFADGSIIKVWGSD